MKKILVACGTAIATSTVVAKKLEEKNKAEGGGDDGSDGKVMRLTPKLQHCLTL